MTKEIETMIKKAKAGDALSQVFLATRYREGDGVRKSVTKALWWYERASFVDPYDDGKPDYLAANYAGLCEELLFEGYHPVGRFFMKRWRSLIASLVRYRYYKKLGFVPGKSPRSLKNLTWGLFSFVGEMMWEIFMVVAPVLIVLAIIALFS